MHPDGYHAMWYRARWGPPWKWEQGRTMMVLGPFTAVAVASVPGSTCVDREREEGGAGGGEGGGRTRRRRKAYSKETLWRRKTGSRRV